jgi:hypothetical protein
MPVVEEALEGMILADQVALAAQEVVVLVILLVLEWLELLTQAAAVVVAALTQELDIQVALVVLVL